VLSVPCCGSYYFWLHARRTITPFLFHSTSFQMKGVSFNHGFKFEAGWAKDEEYHRLIQSAWDSGFGDSNPVLDVQ